VQPIGRALDILYKDGLFQLLLSAKNFGINRSKRILTERLNRVYLPRYNKLKYRIKYQEAAPEPDELIYINPESVKHLLTPHYWKRVSKYTTHVIGGRWDRNYSDNEVIISGWHEGINTPCLVDFDNFVFYNSCKNHFVENSPWKETELYDLLLENMDSYWSYYNSETKIQNTLDSLDKLYHSIKNKGYLQQKEIDSSSLEIFGDSRFSSNYHEVAVNIGRNGEIIFDDGRHRFVIAKILNISEIPVRVLVRHKEWQKIRREVAKASSYTELTLRARNHLGHPDLVNITPESRLYHD